MIPVVSYRGNALLFEACLYYITPAAECKEKGERLLSFSGDGWLSFQTA